MSKASGYCDPAFAKIGDVFTEAIESEFELGASLAIEHKGKMVVDMFGGHKDIKRTKPWEENTIVNVFSVTKGVAATCIAKLIDEGKPVRMDELDKVFQDEFRESQNLSIKELEDRIDKTIKQPGSRDSTTRVFQRSPFIKDYTLRRANGICELCSQKAPFNKPNGEPYLEVHHIIHLADGGEDTIENAVALCPNCHRMMHSLNRKSDIDILILANKARRT